MTPCRPEAAYLKACKGFYLFILISGHYGYWFVLQRIIGIFIDYLKDIGRANGYTVTSAIALVRINSDKKITRGILVTIVG